MYVREDVVKWGEGSERGKQGDGRSRTYKETDRRKVWEGQTPIFHQESLSVPSVEHI